jgi:hypothetical protein
MQSRSNSCAIVFFVVLSSAFSAAALELNDIRIFSISERAALQSRYDVYESNPEIFSEEEFQTIEYNRLAPLIGELILHPQIKIDEPQLLIDYAQEISDSNIEFSVLETRIESYLKKGMVGFDALTRAIEREKFSQWKQRQIHKVKTANNDFIRSIQSSNLKDADKEKLVNVYSVCVAPYTDENERASITPTKCDPSTAYKKPRHLSHKVSVRTSPSSNQNAAHARAYWSFVEETKQIADRRGLDVFERMRMSKCIAEQSLQFVDPADHPFKALSKLVKMHTKSPEETFFMRSGVCGNFSSIAYNMARELGLEG